MGKGRLKISSSQSARLSVGGILVSKTAKSLSSSVRWKMAVKGLAVYLISSRLLSLLELKLVLAAEILTSTIHCGCLVEIFPRSCWGRSWLPCNWRLDGTRWSVSSGGSSLLARHGMCWYIVTRGLGCWGMCSMMILEMVSDEKTLTDERDTYDWCERAGQDTRFSFKQITIQYDMKKPFQTSAKLKGPKSLWVSDSSKALAETATTNQKKIVSNSGLEHDLSPPSLQKTKWEKLSPNL